ncbi:MAG: O-antigen ligase family protein, partial [Blastocatellia bacterium]|nr:O-antigen ligase family protein [Blastocatellia bacterium]
GTNFQKLLKTFTIVIVVCSIPSVLDYLALTAFQGDAQFRARYAKYGEQIVTLLPLLLVFVLRSSGRVRYAAIASVVLIWLLVYTTAGRVNLLLFAFGLAAMAALIFLLSRFKRYRKKFALCLVFIAVAPVPFYIVSLVTGSAQIPIVERFSDTAGSAYSNNFRVLMSSVSLEMIRTAPITGVGADNYGLQFNNFREAYAIKNPDDPNLAHGEVGIVAHAHNEFLQIVAELGLVGGMIFLWFMAGVGLMGIRAIRNVKRGDLHSIASVVGLLMFLASSLVSAYSFRVMQNGILFFFVLAVAAKTTLNDRAEPNTAPASNVRRVNRLVLVGGIAACLALFLYTGSRLTSVIVTQQANQLKDLESATARFRTAAAIDKDNPDPRRTLGMLLLRKKRYAEAAPLLEESITIGRGESADYSYLATALSLSGDDPGAERAIAKAAALYPRSPFVLARYSELLERNGKYAESAAAFDRAVKIDERSAKTWRAMIALGPKGVSDLAARDSSYIQVMELQPQLSIYAVTTERYIMHPEEQRFSFVKVTSNE